MNEKEKIKHLSWRAGFGLSYQQWHSYTKLNDYIHDLFEHAKNVELLGEEVSNEEMQSMMQEDKKDLQMEMRKMEKDANFQWFQQMQKDENALREKVTFFWHDYFACRINNSYWSIKLNNTIRENALGNFKILLTEVSKTSAMLRFLNNQQNKKNAPNENFAREVMELFTMGRDKYSEEDIKEAARAFTGWRSNRLGEFVFHEKRHDTGLKTFLGQTGNWNGDDIIDIILEQPQTAHFVASKIHQHFVSETDDEKQIQWIADKLIENNYEISPTLRALFTVSWFYDSKNEGSIIKSPILLLVGMSRQGQFEFNDTKKCIRVQQSLGQILFKPPNVAGWNEGRAWIDSSTLLFRLNLPMALEKRKIATYKPTNATPFELADFLFQVPLPKANYQLPTKFGIDPMLSFMSTPEYQIC
ncbi:DUF1800 domain-containing protein [Sediminitomix flava]|uniref:Uncharacterized protein (DUF1800 family) n=1 Tax=Sediminitomix flava TaxID=379075 RepID=A0A315ZCE7_SEDFL|nr:DUF1800 domain-containing protein [Sediminitomix flava]PWJ43255.1 uncharacterized protein (DUF1800 family) [Sediminitomix flava]